MTNKRVLTRFKICWELIGENIWIAAKNLKDQYPKKFKKSFLSLIVKNAFLTKQNQI